LPSVTRFHGLEVALRQFGGARALRIVHPGGQVIPEHRHDWPLLTVAVLGGYDEQNEQEAMRLSGATVTLHPAGRCHSNCIHARGMETFSIEFDPDWARFRQLGLHLDRSHYWTVGPVLPAARALASHWRSSAPERDLANLTGHFLRNALASRPVALPRWLAEVEKLTAAPTIRSTAEIARRLDLHPGWLATEYRRATGEGLHETYSRRRIEIAVDLLRTTGLPIADIAAEAGFCDQSHLNRTMRRVIRLTPRQVREEAALLPIG
jgi:AraC-like DNA-binding protein